MGFWGVLFELARAVVPHAAPHVARAVVDAAKERRGTAAGSRSADQPTNQSLAEALSYLDHRITIAEGRAAEAEEKLLAAERQMAERWEYARKLAIGLMAWNGIVTAALIAIIIFILLRR